VEKYEEMESFFEEEIWPRCRKCEAYIQEKGMQTEHDRDKLLVKIEVYGKRPGKMVAPSSSIQFSRNPDNELIVDVTREPKRGGLNLAGILFKEKNSKKLVESYLEDFSEDVGVSLPEDFFEDLFKIPIPTN